MLCVALTRACEHLVPPLPRSDPVGVDARDRWVEPITDGLNSESLPNGDTYSITVPNAPSDTDTDRDT